MHWDRVPTMKMKKPALTRPLHDGGITGGNGGVGNGGVDGAGHLETTFAAQGIIQGNAMSPSAAVSLGALERILVDNVATNPKPSRASREQVN